MNIETIPIEIVALLGKTELPKEVIDQLEIGDILPLDQKTDSPLSLTVDGEKRFSGQPGLSNTQKAIKIKSIP
ncbi:MAG: Flagellar motor switch protein FliM [Chlamydiae bacterium]|nr:Flagellar motor switch protein FliM [Chlamydiota bacterium]